MHGCSIFSCFQTCMPLIVTGTWGVSFGWELWGLNLMTPCMRPGIADLDAGGSSWKDPVPFAVSGLFFRFGSAQAQALIFLVLL